MKTDIEIAMGTILSPISKIAEKAGIPEKSLTFYGRDKAKVEPVKFDKKKSGKLVLVTSINPTPAGEGKTTLAIGLADGLNHSGKQAILALREPSLGPVMGMKGGATGGGRAQVAPMADINLHFTGDIHAITAAHNLISAMLDNHIYQGNVLNIDPEQIVWHRVLDINDRVLREVSVGKGGKANGIEREDHFDITVASEIMAILCLAESLSDLKARIGKILLGYSKSGKPITILDLGAVGAVSVLLKDAIKPNLVQSLEGTPAFVHGGPFANIAHGCNSILATQAALTYGEVTITEAGFGSDLGGEKFLDIKTRQLGKLPDAIVIVATVRALKYHGGQLKEELEKTDFKALSQGFANLRKHIRNMQAYGREVLVTINQFPTDQKEEIDALRKLVEKEKVAVSLSTVHSDGGSGAKELVGQLTHVLDKEKQAFKYLYDLSLPLEEKIFEVVSKIYGGTSVTYSKEALEDLARLPKEARDKLPVCLAKTPYSLSDDAKKIGAPSGFSVQVQAITPKLGAGFIVVLLGKVITMPGLPKHPAALEMDIDAGTGQLTGIF